VDFARAEAAQFPGFQGNNFVIINNPGENVLNGGNGNDLLEGRGGADTLNGGSGFDFASYESSPSSVSVRLQGVGTDTQSFSASGGDASGDTFSSLEGLIGSRFNDSLTGNSLSNVLAGGLGSDTLDGKDGTDTVDYSRDHFFDFFNGSIDTADKVVVNLGLNGSSGTGAEFKVRLSDLSLVQVSTDTLTSIENVTGSRGNDLIVGNELANTLDGREGADTLDGGLGNDTLIGGAGTDTASFLSHDGLTGEIGKISLGLSGADGSATYGRVIFGSFFPIETDALRGIENVTGSNLNETITGNEQANVLDGRGGNDTLDGGLGNDVIIGGNPLFIVGGGVLTSIDTVSYVSHDAVTGVFGQVGQDFISLGPNGTDGSYTRLGQLGVVETDVLRGIENVTGSNRPEAIAGNEQPNTLSGRGGDDTLSGRGGDDHVDGGAGNDVYDFTGSGLGTDTFFDESGTDRVVINSLSDILPETGRDGDDLVVVLTTGTFRIVDHFNGHQIENLVTVDGQSVVLATGLTGGDASGIIAGGNGAETLDGRGGDDFLFGGNGSDRLIGGDGNDRLTGGHGGDTFVFGPGFGHDVVTDFSRADHIEFDGRVFHNFDQVLAASHQVGRDTVITVDADNSITLLGVNLHSLHASHFDFG
jgi:Ca2+-binding RTX toxin-like protein